MPLFEFWVTCGRKRYTASMQCCCKLPIWLPACCSLMKISSSSEVYSTCAYSHSGTAFLTIRARSKAKQILSVIPTYNYSALHSIPSKNEVFSGLLVHQNSLSHFISAITWARILTHSSFPFLHPISLQYFSVKPELSVVQRVVGVSIQYLCVQIIKSFEFYHKKGIKNSYSLRQITFVWNIHDDRKWHYQLLNWSTLWIRAI